MHDQDLITQIIEAKKISAELNRLPGDNFLPRLRLYQQRTDNTDAT